MATVRTLIGNVKGPKGDTGETGATGPAGLAATIEAGSVNSVSYGNPAKVTNVGTPNAAVFNFDIPEGRPGTVGEIAGYPVNTITTQSGNFPTPVLGDTIAQIVGKQVKATTDARDEISNILGDFGTVEPAATASKAYEVGDYLVLDGKFYKVTAAIAQGNALTVGGNIEPTNVGAEVASLNKDLSNTPMVQQLVYTPYAQNWGVWLTDLTAVKTVYEYTPPKSGKYLLCLAPVINSNSNGYIAWGFKTQSRYLISNKQSGVNTTRAASPLFDILTLTGGEKYFAEFGVVGFTDIRLLSPEASWIMKIAD